MVLLGLAQVLFMRGRGLEIVFVSSTRSCLGGSQRGLRVLYFLLPLLVKPQTLTPNVAFVTSNCEL